MGLISDQLSVLVVDYLELLNFVVSVTWVHYRAIAANRFLTGLAVVVQLCSFVGGTLLLTAFGCLSLLLKIVDRACKLIKKSAAYNLINSQRLSTVGTLLLSFPQPFLKTIPACQLWAAGTHNRVLEVSKTNEAFNQLIKIVERFACRVLGSCRGCTYALVNSLSLRWFVFFFLGVIVSRVKVTSRCTVKLDFPAAAIKWRRYSIQE